MLRTYSLGTHKREHQSLYTPTHCHISTPSQTHIVTPSHLPHPPSPHRGSVTMSFMAWSHCMVEVTPFSLRRSLNACLASSLVAYIGFSGSLLVSSLTASLPPPASLLVGSGCDCVTVGVEDLTGSSSELLASSSSPSELSLPLCVCVCVCVCML